MHTEIDVELVNEKLNRIFGLLKRADLNADQPLHVLLAEIYGEIMQMDVDAKTAIRALSRV